MTIEDLLDLVDGTDVRVLMMVSSEMVLVEEFLSIDGPINRGVFEKWVEELK